MGNNYKIIKLTESDLHNIVSDAVKSIIGEGAFNPRRRKILKTVKENGFVISALFEDGDDSMCIEWNREGGPITQTRTEWLRHKKDNLYSTYTNWDELDLALKALGVKKVGQKSHVSDWGGGDTDRFTNSYYDFSSILN